MRVVRWDHAVGPLRLFGYWVFVIWLNGWSHPLTAQPIELSLFDSNLVLEETVYRLRNAGCSEEALEAFKAFAIGERTSRRPLSSGLQVSESGYYRVDGLIGLASLVPPSFTPLFRTNSKVKKHSLTCFDMALLILRDGPIEAPNVRMGFESKHFAFLSGVERRGYPRFQSRSATVSDFIGARYLLQSISSYRRLTGLDQRSTNEENLALCLRAPRMLTGHYANADGPLNRLMESRIELWQRDGIRFSERIQIVLAHYIDLKSHFVAADHIALALPLEVGWMLIEKNGTTNPLIRINFPSLDILADYMMDYFKEDAYNPYSPLHEAAFFVTMNDQILKTRTRQHRKRELGF